MITRDLNFSIYIASPLGFSEAGRFFYYNKLVPTIIEEGFKVIDPWVLTPQSYIEKIIKMPVSKKKIRKLREMNEIIGRNNEKGIRASNGMIAILDGQDVDSGVASEIGVTFELKKKILGYRGDFRLSSENEGTQINIQVGYWIDKSGGKIYTSLDDLRSSLVREFIK